MVDAADLKKNMRAQVPCGTTVSDSDSSLWENRLPAVPNLLSLAAFCPALDTMWSQFGHSPRCRLTPHSDG
jgi:hypothetical protein